MKQVAEFRHTTGKFRRPLASVHSRASVLLLQQELALAEKDAEPQLAQLVWHPERKALYRLAKHP